MHARISQVAHYCATILIVNNTRKLKRTANQIAASLPESQQRHYAVWRYMNKYSAPISEAYQHVYQCSADSAKAAASRLKASPEWHELVDRMESAVGLSAEDVRAIVSSEMLTILRDPKSAPCDKTKASDVLAKMYGLNEQKVTVSVDPVAQYAQQCLAAAEEQPLIPFAKACIPMDDDENIVDV